MPSAICHTLRLTVTTYLLPAARRSFHISRCAEDGATPSAISRTFLLLHLLLQDAAALPALWPITPLTPARQPAESFTDLVARLDPSMACAAAEGEEGAEGEFDPVLCHVRRVLFWLESTCSHDVMEARMKDLFQGLTVPQKSPIPSQGAVILAKAPC